MLNATINSNTSDLYCDLDSFQRNYRSIHGYLSIAVCIFGSLTNVANIFVLTTKDMRMPTNMILTGLAVADLLVMLEYIPFSIQSYLKSDVLSNPDHFSYSSAVFMFFHALFTLTCHFIACCLTVILAVWRYIAITYPQNNKIWCNIDRTKTAIILCYLLCPFICTPVFLGLNIQHEFRYLYDNDTIVQHSVADKLNATELHEYKNTTIYFTIYVDSYKKLNFWLYGVIIKLLPCVQLTVLSVCLIRALLAAKKRWKALANSSGVPLVNGDAKKQKNIEKEQQADRVTRMLLAVLLLFLITEIPQAILGLLSGLLGEDFEKQCYRTLGDLMDIIALTNSAINFILYCAISQQFRTEFKKVFCANWITETCDRKHAETTEITTV